MLSYPRSHVFDVEMELQFYRSVKLLIIKTVHKNDVLPERWKNLYAILVRPPMNKIVGPTLGIIRFTFESWLLHFLKFTRSQIFLELIVSAQMYDMMFSPANWHKPIREM